MGLSPCAGWGEAATVARLALLDWALAVTGSMVAPHTWQNLAVSRRCSVPQRVQIIVYPCLSKGCKGRPGPCTLSYQQV